MVTTFTFIDYINGIKILKLVYIDLISLVGFGWNKLALNM